MPSLLTTTAGKALVLFTASVSHGTEDRVSVYTLYVDSTPRFSVRIGMDKTNETGIASLSYLVPGLAAGTHTFEIYWSSTLANTISQSGATYGRTLTVVEYPN